MKYTLFTRAILCALTLFVSSGHTTHALLPRTAAIGLGAAGGVTGLGALTTSILLIKAQKAYRKNPSDENKKRVARLKKALLALGISSAAMLLSALAIAKKIIRLEVDVAAAFPGKEGALFSLFAYSMVDENGEEKALEILRDYKNITAESLMGTRPMTGILHQAIQRRYPRLLGAILQKMSKNDASGYLINQPITLAYYAAAWNNQDALKQLEKFGLYSPSWRDENGNEAAAITAYYKARAHGYTPPDITVPDHMKNWADKLPDATFKPF